MKPKNRWFVAGTVASLLMMVLAFLLLRPGAEPNSVPPENTKDTIHVAVAPVVDEPASLSDSSAEPPTEVTRSDQAVNPPQVDTKSEEHVDERPIEEILAEEGEDPGAVFYMSRVREALSEGNPKFARQLLRQMRQLHPDSVLVRETQQLLRKR